MNDFKKLLNDDSAKKYIERSTKICSKFNIINQPIVKNKTVVSVERVNIVSSMSKTGFIGFCIGTQSFENIYKMYV